MVSNADGLESHQGLFTELGLNVCVPRTTEDAAGAEAMEMDGAFLFNQIGTNALGQGAKRRRAHGLGKGDYLRTGDIEPVIVGLEVTTVATGPADPRPGRMDAELLVDPRVEFRDLFSDHSWIRHRTTTVSVFSGLQSVACQTPVPG